MKRMRMPIMKNQTQRCWIRRTRKAGKKIMKNLMILPPKLQVKPVKISKWWRKILLILQMKNKINRKAHHKTVITEQRRHEVQGQSYPPYLYTNQILAIKQESLLTKNYNNLNGNPILNV